MRQKLRTREETAVEPTTFDTLSKQVMRKVGRRTALATLLGSVLLWRTSGASEATKEAQRRQKRRRKQRRRQRRRQSGAALLRPIAITVDNTAGPRAITVELGDWPRLKCCRSFPPVSVPVGTSQRFAASFAEAYVWIDGFYWLSFQNPAGKPPNVRAATNGMADRAMCCKPVGRTVVEGHTLLVGRPKPISMARYDFVVTRTADTNYKNFTVVVR